jgi:hypothetical protein
MIDDEAEVRISRALSKPRIGAQPSDQHGETTDSGGQNNRHGADGGDWMKRRRISSGQRRRTGQRWKNEKGDPQ